MTKKFFIITLVFAFVASSLFVSAGTSHAASKPVLNPGPASSVQMLQQPLNDLDAAMERAMAEKVMPGAVVLIAKNGTIVKHQAYGYALKYVDRDFTESENPVVMEKDTIFDLASLSKLFTVTAAMQLFEEGKFELDDPVAAYIPEFAENGKSEVTIRQLMTHTSGFKPWLPLYNMADSREEAFEIVFSYPLENEPGTHYAYSDLNMITLGALVEQWSGKRLDQYVKENITEPLNMEDTMYNPPASLKNRIAATAYVAGRGMIRGTVHDGNSLVLDGVAGHAGVFSTARDMSVFSQMMLNEGIYNDTRILKTETVQLIVKNHLPEFPGNDHGLGWELNQEWYMGALAEPSTIGHTGFTGTSMVVSPNKNTIAILFTNRVHPTADTPSTNPIRRKVAGKTADAIYAWSAASMKERVKRFEKKGEFEDNGAIYKLKLHLTAVSQYEDEDQAEKVIKHMNGLKLLLDNQRENGLISEEAYETLRTDAGYLIDKWQ